MKNVVLNFTAVVFLTAIFALPVNANEKKVNNVSESAKTEVSKELSKESSADATAEVNKLLTRLNEIKEMDIASMNAKEKKELRKEVRSIRNDLKSYSESNATAKAAAEGEANRGIFISTGAAIIIVLLLILIL